MVCKVIDSTGLSQIANAFLCHQAALILVCVCVLTSYSACAAEVLQAEKERNGNCKWLWSITHHRHTFNF